MKPTRVTNAIRALRFAHDEMTQAELARRLGVTRQTVIAIEQGRYSLVAALSDDEGATWKWRRHLDGLPSLKEPEQYHYPSVLQGKDGTIHVTYSYFVRQADKKEGKSIKHARFMPDWILGS